jgi:two-component system, chemotaxis family, CheB/CheR fusion protein
MIKETDQDLEELLLMLRETRGFDFTGYKRTTVTRRIGRRMQACGVDTIADYRDFLELEPDEFARLFDSLLINVTGFFRDPPAWQELRDQALPEIMTAKGAARPIRIWSAGCATGEEAYTLAIVLTEMLGQEIFTRRVKIYATDLDEDALQQARVGVYTERQVANVSEQLRQKYFEVAGSRYSFRRDLRRQIIFGRNDLTRDAPISRVDLLVARNTLMYFTAETQSAIVKKFHFALADPGFLFLGKAEMLLNHGEQFEPLDLRKRLFRKIRSADMSGELRPARPGAAMTEGMSDDLESSAFSAGPVAQLVINRVGRLSAANIKAETLFNIHPRSIGQPFQDLEISYQPVELRSVIDRVKQEQHEVELTDIAWNRPEAGKPTFFNINLMPLLSSAGQLLGVEISFLDVTRYRTLRDDLERSNQELVGAYDQLQSLNEELETTNEELQSTNEELETTNEELQSTNDELQAINEVLRMRSAELDSANSFMATVMRGLGNAVIVVNNDLRVRVWSPGAGELWGLRPDEAEGKPLPGLDIGLPMRVVTPMVQRILSQSAERLSADADATNRRGRPVRIRIDGCLLRDDDGGSQGVILMMNDSVRKAELQTP